jgi:hypothetical protein
MVMPHDPVWQDFTRQAYWDDYRTMKWLSKVACPEIFFRQVQDLLPVA